MSVVCCHVQVSANGRSVDQRSSTECGVFECTREISTLRRPGSTRAGKLRWRGGGRREKEKEQIYFTEYSFICLSSFKEEC
jgi:hypothetical protein